MLLAVTSVTACDENQNDDKTDVCNAAIDARSDAVVEWGIPLDPCEEEVCEDAREGECIVNALAGDGPIVVTLDCEYSGLGATTDVLTIDLHPGGVIDLSVGAKVSLAYKTFGAFEYGGWSMLRIRDDAGLVFAHTSGGISGGLTGDPDWGSKRVAEAVAPLTGSVTNAGCDDDSARNYVTLLGDGTSVAVPSGSSGTLAGDSAWLVVVESSTRPPGELDDETLDVAMLRLEP